MALSVSSSTSGTSSAAGPTKCWVDFYVKNKDDKGPIQALFTLTHRDLAQRTKCHLADPNELTETIVGSSHGNMLMVSGEKGVMQILHHGFGASTNNGFTLIFAQGNLEDTTVFKTLPRVEAVSPLVSATGRCSRNVDVPQLTSMLEAASADAFAGLVTEGNPILNDRPNHLLISPRVFVLADGARTVSAKVIPFEIIKALVAEADDNSERQAEKEQEREWIEELLAVLWASEKGMLNPIHLPDVPETPLMNHMIRSVREKLGTGTVPATVGHPGTGAMGEMNHISLYLMATSSQNLVSILNRIQDGTEDDKIKKDAEKSILKTMGPTQRALFLALCTSDMTRTPEMTEFMQNLTSLRGSKRVKIPFEGTPYVFF